MIDNSKEAWIESCARNGDLGGWARQYAIDAGATAEEIDAAIAARTARGPLPVSIVFPPESCVEATDEDAEYYAGSVWR